jgi:hypothetical protein
MKPLRRVLRILSLLMCAATLTGTGWLVRLAVESQLSASGDIDGAGVPGGWEDWRPLSPEAPFGPWGLLAEPEVDDPVTDWPASPLAPNGVEPGSQGGEPSVKELLDDLRFWPSSPGHKGGEAPMHSEPAAPEPPEPEPPTLALLLMPECGLQAASLEPCSPKAAA